jgi:iron complex outermembrane receptor protein
VLTNPYHALAQERLLQEEIIVTARKKSESLQRVPLSITPFSAADIDKRGYNRVEDIARATPGFSFEGFSTGGTYGNPVIRGMTNTFTTARVQNVSFFLDGVYLQRQSMLNIGLVDMARIEVVKGPQSALYGRNAFSGAVNYITSKPSEEFEGYLGVTLGTDEREDYRVSLSGPLGTDRLLGKLTYATTEYDGHTENDHPLGHVDGSGVNTVDNLGGWDDETLSLGLSFRPTDRINIGLGYYDSEAEREAAAYYVVGGLGSIEYGFRTEEQNDLNCNFIEGATQGLGQPVFGESVYCGTFGTAPPAENRTIPGITVDPRGIGAVLDNEVLTLSFDWEINDTLALTYLYGRAEHESYTNGGGGGDEDNLVGSPQLYDFSFNYAYSNAMSGRPIAELETDSHELRFNWSANDRLNASFGVYYSKVEDEQSESLFFLPICSDRDQLGLFANGTNADEIANCSMPGTSHNTTSVYEDAGFFVTQDFARQHNLPLNHTKYEDKIMAFFFSGTYSLTDSLDLTFEGRYTEEDKEIQRITDVFGLAADESNYAGPSRIAETEYDDEMFYFFTPRVFLEWSMTDTNFLYVSAAKGVKTGGFNNTTVEDQLSYGEEENWTYEIGSKNTLMDGRLTLNGVLYYIDWTDLQSNQPPTDTGGSLNSNVVIVNAGDAESIGAELESTWLISENLSVDFGYAYNDPELGDNATYYSAVQFFRCDGSVCPADGDVSGNQLARTSKHQVNWGVNGYFRTGNWDFEGRLDGAYQSEQYVSPMNVGKVPSRTLWNTSFSLNYGEHWEFNLWGKNIFDKKYASSVFIQSQFSRYLVSLGDRRSWGISAKYLF